jgi:predicted Zn-dependent protease
LIQAGSYGRATNVLSQALQLHSGSVELIEAQGDLHLQQNQDSEAKQAYLKCLAINPNSLRVRVSLAKVYLGMREMDAAQEQLEEVLRIQPYNPEANAQLGRMAFEAAAKKRLCG